MSWRFWSSPTWLPKRAKVWCWPTEISLRNASRRSNMASNELPSSMATDLDDMSVIEKLVFRSKQQPLVPLGCLATTVAVAMAAKGVRTGDAPKAQFWFRWRVGLQGATLIALVFGSFYFDRAFTAQQEEQIDIDEQKAKLREKLWIEELERRDLEMKQRQERAERARQLMEQNSKRE